MMRIETNYLDYLFFSLNIQIRFTTTITTKNTKSNQIYFCNIIIIIQIQTRPLNKIKIICIPFRTDNSFHSRNNKLSINIKFNFFSFLSSKI